MISSDFFNVILSDRINILLILSLFLMALGSYAIIPFYIFYMTKYLGISSIEVGILLSANVFSQRGLALVVGFLIDKFGSRRLMLIGIFFRVISFILLSSARSFELLLVATLLSGLGVAIAQTAGKTLLLNNSQHIASLLATRTIALNLGVIIGPALGYLLLSWSFPVICYSVAGVFSFIFILFYIELPRSNTLEKKDSDRFVYKSFFNLLLTPAIFLVLFLQACFHFFYTALEIAFPFYAKDYFSASIVGAIFTVNAVVAVLFQIPAAYFMKRNIPFGGAGLALMALSFFITGLSSSNIGSISVFYFMMAIVVFSISEVFIMLFVDVTLARRVDKNQLGKFFGLSSFFAMIGAIVGNNLLGYCLSLVHDKTDYTIFWYSLGGGACVIMLLFIISDFLQLKKMQKESHYNH